MPEWYAFGKGEEKMEWIVFAVGAGLFVIVAVLFIARGSQKKRECPVCTRKGTRLENGTYWCRNCGVLF